MFPIKYISYLFLSHLIHFNGTWKSSNVPNPFHPIIIVIVISTSFVNLRKSNVYIWPFESNMYFVTVFLIKFQMAKTCQQEIRKRKCDREHEQDLSYRAGIPNILSLNLDQVIKMSTAMFVTLSRLWILLEQTCRLL